MKESLREQKCVTRHIAALVHGSKFMIIMPLANHYNLEVFFCEGMQLLKNTEESERRYDFGDKFPSIRTDGDLHKAVVKQVFQLADALQWLHHDLGDFEKQNRYLAHMDLKPENILIYGNPQNETTPVGQWMVTDFGISAFYKASNKPIQEAPTIRDVTSRLTPYAVRGRGPYQPPEIGLESKKEEADSGLRDRHSLDYRQCDVWSFGCVLSDVLAFALNRSQGVLDLRKARDQDGNDNFYKFVEKVEAMANISASNTKLKEGFVNWGDQIRESNAGSWVLGYLDILFKHSIVPCPSDRKRIKSIKDRLGELYPVSSPPNSNILTNQEGLDITPIQGPHEKHVKDSQEHPALPNTHMEGLGGARNVQTASLPNAMSTVPSRAFIRQPQDSPSQSSSSITMDRKSLVNGVTGGPPFVLVQSQKISADDHQLQIVDGEIICSSIPVPLDKKASVKAVALDSTGERIAILCEAEVVIFPTTLPKSSDQKSLHIPTGVKWNRVRIAHPGLAIFGAISSGEIMVSYATSCNAFATCTVLL